ncbi:PREDICTED: RNA-binding protein 7 [Ceratosolen solmsi marchali]|uniref:RNA-binding protein 7 n=1 Tax=Ceratosolen solmsi marchali TaxID=326594 RepID=A0AAJ6YKH6_9HYME|nr:PREDICTED: RNA-binding protein 7 [Ceratosolen solmsi marchali]
MDDDENTIWCGNLHDKVTEDILYELFMQGGPVTKVNIPKDRDGKQKNFGFVTYKHVCSVPYALDLFDGTVLFNRPMNMKSRSNNLDSSHHQQQQQPQGNVFDNRRDNQNELYLGQQILLGAIAPMAYISNSPNTMFMMPGSVAYPSQTSLYSQTPQNSAEYNRSNRHHSRNHPYIDHDRYNDRHSSRQESFNRDHKSYKSSSHRSNRHDKRKYY